MLAWPDVEMMKASTGVSKKPIIFQCLQICQKSNSAIIMSQNFVKSSKKLLILQYRD